MEFDRDLRYLRRLYLGLAILLFSTIVANVYLRSWLMVFSSVCWTACCVVMFFSCGVQQRTRDEVRVTHAAMKGIIEEAGRGL